MAGVYISNVQRDCTEDNFMSFLRKTIGQDTGNLQPILYTSKDGMRKVAVVTGFQKPIDEVIGILQNAKFMGRKLRVLKDTGDERDEYGNFKHPQSSMEKRKLNHLFGKTNRKVKVHFETRFMNDIEETMSLQNAGTFVYLNDLPRNQILRAGELCRVEPVTRLNPLHGVQFCYIEYETIVETIQAISLLNLYETSTGIVAFSNSQGSHVSRVSRSSGIGINGDLLNVKDLVNLHGYIPFKTMDCQILNKSNVNSLKGICWKCKSSDRHPEYTVVGFSPNLDYYCGICQCDYEMDLPVTDGKRPFKNAGERFTRLTENRNQDEEQMGNLIPQHDSMKITYSSAGHFRDVTFPILYDEWKTTSTSFKANNTTDKASLVAMEFIESLEKESGETLELYQLEFLVPRTGFWREDCYLSIRHMTIKMDVWLNDKEKLKEEIKKAKVSRATNESDLCVRVYVKAVFGSRRSPVLQDCVTLVPKAIKLEYKNTVATLNKWAKEDFSEGALQFVLDPESVVIKAPCNIFPIRSGSMRRRVTAVTRLKMDLNTEQKLALETAQTKSMSVVQGPPGTGKTFLASTTALILALTEKERVIACASSNFAVDGLAIKIKALIDRHGLDISVLRVYAKTAEKEYIRKHLNPLEAKGVPCLHQEVTNHELWLIGEEFDKVRETWINLESVDTLKKEDYDLYENHKKTLENLTFGRYTVIVSTIGCLADRRVSEWSKGSRITTVLVDEVGQTKQTDIPFLFRFNQRRTVFFGDHMQLKPHVMSLGASHAGLDVSCMEWISLGGKSVPWTVLKEQYRMNSGIRSLVSNVTYNNELRDSQHVQTRRDEILEPIYEIFKELKHSDVIVYNHKHMESKLGGRSVYNQGEAVLVTGIVGTLVLAGMDPLNITVLTLYDAQKRLIKELLNERKLFVAVENVDGFQGRENHLIILSLSRSNDSGSIGFAKSPNRINVAISRAMYKLMIVSNLSVFQKSNLLPKFRNELLKNAKIINME